MSTSSPSDWIKPQSNETTNYTCSAPCSLRLRFFERHRFKLIYFTSYPGSLWGQLPAIESAVHVWAPSLSLFLCCGLLDTLTPSNRPSCINFIPHPHCTNAIIHLFLTLFCFPLHHLSTLHVPLLLHAIFPLPCLAILIVRLSPSPSVSPVFC